MAEQEEKVVDEEVKGEATHEEDTPQKHYQYGKGNY
jgi:hypothetical protein